jgi:hypothetical protein
MSTCTGGPTLGRGLLWRAPRLGLLLLALTLPGPATADEAGPLALEAPASVAGLRVGDVDGDGVQDLLALEGREVRVWTGARGRLPARAPRWRVLLPAEVSFVDVAREGRPALLALGEAATQRLALLPDGATRATSLPDVAGLGWRDGAKAVFADLHPDPLGPEHLAPVPAGWVLRSEAGARALEVAPARVTTAPGPFLEDAAVLTEGLPHVLALAAHGAARSAERVLWSLAGDSLVRLEGKRRDVYDLSFLPATGQRRLLDVDGDQVPEVLHGEGDNRSLKLAFFRLPGPRDGTPPPPGDLRPPFAYLKLSGFSLEPVFVDLDADGRLDVVVTTIDIDGPNVLRAVTSGRVAAQTRAFLQRRSETGLPAYPAQPDAAVASDVGVKIRFGYAGNLDIARSFTIVPQGDLDGDGRRDLVIRTGLDRLAVRAGAATGVWAGEARVLPIPPLGEGEELDALPADLDGDGRDELVLHVRAAPGGRDRLLVIR